MAFIVADIVLFLVMNQAPAAVLPVLQVPPAEVQGEAQEEAPDQAPVLDLEAPDQAPVLEVPVTNIHHAQQLAPASTTQQLTVKQILLRHIG